MTSENVMRCHQMINSIKFQVNFGNETKFEELNASANKEPLNTSVVCNFSALFPPLYWKGEINIPSVDWDPRFF